MAAYLRRDAVVRLASSIGRRCQKREARESQFPVRRTSRSRLREVDFQFETHELRGLEQNPETASRWAQLARQGKKVMQFLQQRRYIAVVVDGEVKFYGKPPLLNGAE
jgi:hypothetical protein